MKKDAKDEDPLNFLDPETPLGDKKKLSLFMAKQYSPAAVEKLYVVLFRGHSQIMLFFLSWPLFYVITGADGMPGGKNLAILWQNLIAQNHLLSL